MTLHAGSDIKILFTITYRVKKNFLRENDVKFEFHFFFQGNQRYSFPNNREEKFQIRPTKADNVLPFLEQNFAEEKFSRYNELFVFYSIFIIQGVSLYSAIFVLLLINCHSAA